MDSNHRRHSQQIYSLPHLATLVTTHKLSFRASCRIRTNDPEITNHVLWPTELKRRVGKLAISRRYNQLPLLRSSPGGFIRSWPYRTYPFLFCECKGRHYFQNYNTFEYFFLILAEKIHFSPITIGRIPVKEVLLCTY